MGAPLAILNSELIARLRTVATKAMVERVSSAVIRQYRSLVGQKRAVACLNCLPRSGHCSNPNRKSRIRRQYIPRSYPLRTNVIVDFQPLRDPWVAPAAQI